MLGWIHSLWYLMSEIGQLVLVLVTYSRVVRACWYDLQTDYVKGVWPYQHLDFGPVKLIWDF